MDFKFAQTEFVPKLESATKTDSYELSRRR